MDIISEKAKARGESTEEQQKGLSELKNILSSSSGDSESSRRDVGSRLADWGKFFLQQTEGPLLAQGVNISEIGTGKLFERWARGEMIVNRSLVSKLIVTRISEYSIDRPFAMWLRSKIATKITLQDGSTFIVPPLNTNNTLIKKKTTMTQISFQQTTYMSIPVTPKPLPILFDYQLPEYPYREEILPALNQMLCGCCWALSTASAVSDAFVVSGLVDKNPQLSYTYALTCYPYCKSASDPMCFRQNPEASLQCGGGNFQTLCEWIVENGLPSETCVDYHWCTSSDSCTISEPSVGMEGNLNKSIPSCGCYTAQSNYQFFYISQVESVFLDSNQLEDIDAIRDLQNKVKRHIMEIGPVLTGFHVFSNFMSGQYQNKERPEYNPFNIYLEFVGNQLQPSKALPDFQGCHAVVVVGWAELPIHSSLLPESTQSLVVTDEKGFTLLPCWKIRNSWGSSWSKNGFAYFAMYPFNSTSCFEAQVKVKDPGGSIVEAGGMVLFRPADIRDQNKDQNDQKGKDPNKDYSATAYRVSPRSTTPSPDMSSFLTSTTPTPTPLPDIPVLMETTSSTSVNLPPYIWYTLVSIVFIIIVALGLRELKKKLSSPIPYPYPPYSYPHSSFPYPMKRRLVPFRYPSSIMTPPPSSRPPVNVRQPYWKNRVALKK